MKFSTRRSSFLFASVIALWALASCEAIPRDEWTLTGDGITVTVHGSPYSYTVRDGKGKTVLTSRSNGAGDGYGAIGWTTGETRWSKMVSPGYFKFTSTLDAWRDRWEVEDVVESGAKSLVVTLKDTATRRRIRVKHSIRASTLRVESTVSGDAPSAWSAAFAAPAGEDYLGFGERMNRTSQRGVTLYSWAEEGGLSKGEDAPPGPTNPFPNGGTMTYYPVPFFISTAGYGFWLDSTWRNEFNMASERDDAWRVWATGPSLAYEIYVPIPGDPRPWPLQIIDLFTGVTGRPMIPPAWSFGPRRRINSGDVQLGVPEIQAMRDLDLPISVADDARHFLPHGSGISEQPALKAWVAAANQLGYEVIAYFNGNVATEPDASFKPEVDKALAKGYFMKNKDGKTAQTWMISGKPQGVYTVDFTNPDAVAWYQSLFTVALDIGYAGWMLDFGEYIQPENLTSTGITGEEFHNMFPVVYQKAAYEGLEKSKRKGNWFFFTRSGYTGAQQWSPMVWSGDPDASFGLAMGLPAHARGGINLGITGVAHWGSDIGGYKCLAPDGSAKADGEMLTRWIQKGAMESNMHDEDACAQGDGPKATIFDSMDAQQAWRKYARLHTRLLPYFLTLAHEAHLTGAPVIRHVFLENPDRADLAGVDDAYYLGPALYAAPVMRRGARTKKVQLPAGHYLDWEAQKLVEGGQEVTLEAPLSKLPLLLRDGYLVPLLDPRIVTLIPGYHPGVTGPDDVDPVYDVVGLLSTGKENAAFTLWDGGTLQTEWKGAFENPAFAKASTEDELAACAPCWRRDVLSDKLSRVRISSAAKEITAGGLTLKQNTGRTIRWDLYLVQD